MNPSLSLLVFGSSRLDRLKIFYELLGCEFVSEKHGNGPKHYAADFGEWIFELYPLSDESFFTSFSGRLGFRVSELDNIITQVEVCGGKVVHMPKASPRGYRAVIQDPDGRKVELVEEGS